MRTLTSTGDFDRVSRENICWRVSLSGSRVVALWSTFSDVISLPPVKRHWFLGEVRRVADEEFGGKVEMPMLTTVYTARRV